MTRWQTQGYQYLNQQSFETEFRKAEQFFQQHPDQVKYSRKDSGLRHSYLKLTDGTIVSMGSHKGLHVLGEGSFGRVKIGMDKFGGWYALKIVGEDAVSAEEADVLEDVGLTAGGVLSRAGKYYYPLIYLGTPLHKDISFTSSFEERLDLARRVAWEVHQLHVGKLSNQNIAYVHRDLKPSNILVDGKQVSLIDFGFAHPLSDLDNSSIEYAGTVAFLPYRLDEEKACHQLYDEEIALMNRINELSRKLKAGRMNQLLGQSDIARCHRQIGLLRAKRSQLDDIVFDRIKQYGFKSADVFALKRTLFGRDGSLFTQQEMDTHPFLKSMLDTCDSELALQKKDTALDVAFACFQEKIHYFPTQGLLQLEKELMLECVELLDELACDSATYAVYQNQVTSYDGHVDTLEAIADDISEAICQKEAQQKTRDRSPVSVVDTDQVSFKGRLKDQQEKGSEEEPFSPKP